LGDPDGIGPEITAKAWERLHGKAELAFALVCEGPAPDLPIPTIESDWSSAARDFASGLPVIAANKSSLSAPTQAARSIALAVDATLAGHTDGVVTNPISKERLYAEGFAHPGHTEYLAELTADADGPYARGPVMMLAAGDQLRCALVSIHESLRDMLNRLTPERIERAARTLHGALVTDFGIEAPRIALSGLNPHAGEGGSLGREEIEIINPCAARLRAEGLQITDALPADTLFHEEARETYDAVLAMYHDQGLIPVKSLDFHNGVNITLGLPIIRTSPDHGTAFNIAGQGIARPDSLIAAIRMARRLADNRYG
jgi:4-hydroxythreonine-4-phosphate dehydrogenase